MSGTTTPLFSPHLISTEVLSTLPEGYTIRPLQKSDYHKHFLDVLKVLTKVGDISEEAWNERYDWMKRREGDYFILVVLDGGVDGSSSTTGTSAEIVGGLEARQAAKTSGTGSATAAGSPPAASPSAGSTLADRMEAKVSQDEPASAVGDTSANSESHRRIVGTGALVVERKFIHNLGLVGHIEDIAVTKDQQGKKLGLRIIQALDHVAKEVGCYKSILDCSEANEGFYVKCGFKRAGLEMAHYHSS